MVDLSNIFNDFSKVIEGDVNFVCRKPTLILAMTARTGSTQLCSLLESIEVFGSPDEILNTRGVVQNNIKRNGALSFVDYIDKLTSIDAPCFSFKTSWLDFKPISQVWMKIFPKAEFVFLDRLDIVAQAFSLLKAIETGQWHFNVNSITEISSLRQDQVNAERVQSLMKTLMHEKLQWEKFFFSNRLMVPHIYYEIIKDDWSTAASLIAEQFGFHNQLASSGGFIRLSSESDEQLIDQFKKERGYTWLSV